jgi:hypothetical protein
MYASKAKSSEKYFDLKQGRQDTNRAELHDQLHTTLDRHALQHLLFSLLNSVCCMFQSSRNHHQAFT